MDEKDPTDLTEEELEEQRRSPAGSRGDSLVTPPIGADGISTITPVEPPSEI